MSEVKSRTLQDIQLDYTNLCNKAGHVSYQINSFQKDLEMLYKGLRDLNLEAAALQKREAEVAKALAEAKAKETTPEAPKLSVVSQETTSNA